MTYALKPIQVEAGVSPSTDSTPQATTHYTFSDKVRFVDGVPEKIGGNAVRFMFSSGNIASGTIRMFGIR